MEWGDRRTKDISAKILENIRRGRIDACTVVAAIEHNTEKNSKPISNKKQKYFLAVSRKKRLVYLCKFTFDSKAKKSNFSVNPIYADNILSIDIVENGLNRTAHLSIDINGHQILGPAGIVLHQNCEPRIKISETFFKITMKDIHTPITEIHFLSGPLRQKSNHHLATLKHIEKWYAILQIMLRDSDWTNRAPKTPSDLVQAPKSDKAARLPGGPSSLRA